LGIVSWLGPSSELDRARITLLMDETLVLKSQVKWTVYREQDHPTGQEPTKANIEEHVFSR
jgi:hypothetical protein